MRSQETTANARVALPKPGKSASATRFTVLVGMRTGLGALFASRHIRTLTWVTRIGMTVGGLVLGPLVQKYAFGACWTGFPWGYDLTDNKLGRVGVAASVLGTGRPLPGASRSRSLPCAWSSST